VQRAALDENGGRCRDAGGTADGSAAFLYLSPCAAAVTASAELDTTQLSNGAHRVQVSVIDAAGNAATVLDRTVTVANAPACAAPHAATGAAILAASWRGTARQAITAGFAHAHAIEGRLTTAAGAPIAGALVEASSAPISGGAAAAPNVVGRTAFDGSFSVGVPGGGPSRSVCLALRSAGGIGVPLATRTLELRVRAPVALAIAPRRVGVGGTIRFSGRLRGGHVPTGGKQVILEARSAHSGWLQFRVVRSDAAGRFRASYRFRFAGPADYEFRAVCEAEADYPFAKGYSTVVRVHER
jgi:hypothetical protein